MLPGVQYIIERKYFSELCAKTLQQKKKEAAPTINVPKCNALPAVHESEWYLGARSSPQLSYFYCGL